MAISTMMGTGTTGVNIFQEGLKVVSNNIANTDTVGFKENDINFSELVAGGIAGMGKTQIDKFQVGRGSAVHNIRNIFSQGTLNQTTNALDLTIEGEGFFVLKDPAGSAVPLFTRAGAFDDGRHRIEEGRFGLVTNADGFLLQGAKVTFDPITGQRTIGKVDNIDLSDHTLPPVATANAHFTLNLFADDPDIGQDVTGVEPTNFDALSGGSFSINGVSGFGEIQASSDAIERIDDLIAEINFFQDETGVVASKATDTTLTLTSTKGGPIIIKFDPGLDPDVAAKTGLQEGSFLAENFLTGKVTSNIGTKKITGVDTRFSSQLAAGDVLTIGTSRFTVASVQSDTELTVTQTITAESGDLFDVSAAVQRAAFSTPITFFDSLGKDHVVNVRFVKTATNTWEWSAVVGGKDNLNGAFDEVQATGALGFTPTGELDIKKVTAALFPTDGFDFKGGSAPNQKIAFDFLGTSEHVKSTVTQFGAPTGSVLLKSTQDGFSSGELDAVSVDADGFINGRYSNGKIRALYQVMIAKFPNQEGLRRVGKNLYIQTDQSGEAIQGVAGKAGRGLITAGALEQSTVDLAKQFVSLISYERGFQANSRVIVTGDEVTQELINLKR